MESPPTIHWPQKDAKVLVTILTSSKLAMSSSIAVGIDLGTTFSVVACLDGKGQPKSLPNAEGDLTTPSVVFMDDDEVLVGKEAIKAGAFDPDRLAQFAKRDMGEPAYSKLIAGQEVPPEVIQSYVLAKLKADAEAKIGPITKAVITVPAYFNEPRRKATEDAGRLAGLDVIDIINEPTAAAIAFGVASGFLNERGESLKTERIVIYDLGGGTFDVTVMEINGQEYRVKATGGDVYLGGVDWDYRLVELIAQKFMERHPDLDPREDPVGMQRLLKEAEDAKRSLSARDQVTVLFEYKGEGVRAALSRVDFEHLTSDLLERTRFTTQNVLRDAGWEWRDVTRLLLVGGSSRMPMVSRMLTKLTGRSPDTSLSLDEAVAHGAAIYAGVRLAKASGDTRKGPQPTIQNVNSHALSVLGVEAATGRPRAQVMIPRNSPLPAVAKSTFKTQKPNQRSVVVRVIEGGDASGNNSTPVGRCVIRDLPERLPQGTPIEVTFRYRSNGRLVVMAKVPSLNVEATLTIDRESGLNDEAMRYWDEILTKKRRPPLRKP